MLKHLHPGYQIATVLIACVLYIIIFSVTGYLLTSTSSQIQQQRYHARPERFRAYLHQHYLEYAWGLALRILFFVIPLILAALFGTIAAISSSLILGLFRFSFHFVD